MVCDACSEVFFELLLSPIFAQVVSSAIPYPGHASVAVVTTSPMPHWPGTGLFSADGSSALCSGDCVSDPDDIMTDGVSSSPACTVSFLEGSLFLLTGLDFVSADAAVVLTELLSQINFEEECRAAFWSGDVHLLVHWLQRAYDEHAQAKLPVFVELLCGLARSSELPPAASNESSTLFNCIALVLALGAPAQRMFVTCCVFLSFCAPSRSLWQLFLDSGLFFVIFARASLVCSL
jgi:hypothetical protein